MKKVIFTILVSVLLSLPFYNANAQKLSTEYDEVRSTKYEEIESVEYTKFKWNIASIGFPFPQGAGIDDPSSHILVVTEPQYLITNNIGISLKLERTDMSRVYSNTTSGVAVRSSMPTGIYYFDLRKNNIRPWVSLGVGYAEVARANVYALNIPTNVDQNATNLSDIFTSLLIASTSFSFEEATGLSASIRAGIDLWRFTVAIAYNIIPISRGTRISLDENFNLVRRNVESSNNYFGITIGFFIGGGKKKK